MKTVIAGTGVAATTTDIRSFQSDNESPDIEVDSAYAPVGEDAFITATITDNENRVGEDSVSVIYYSQGCNPNDQECDLEARAEMQPSDSNSNMYEASFFHGVNTVGAEFYYQISAADTQGNERTTSPSSIVVTPYFETEDDVIYIHQGTGQGATVSQEVLEKAADQVVDKAIERATEEAVTRIAERLLSDAAATTAGALAGKFATLTLTILDFIEPAGPLPGWVDLKLLQSENDEITLEDSATVDLDDPLYFTWYAGNRAGSDPTLHITIERRDSRPRDSRTDYEIPPTILETEVSYRPSYRIWDPDGNSGLFRVLNIIQNPIQISDLIREPFSKSEQRVYTVTAELIESDGLIQATDSMTLTVEYSDDSEDDTTEELPVTTLEPEPYGGFDGEGVRLRGEIHDLQGYDGVDYGFEYRPVGSEDWEEHPPVVTKHDPGEFSQPIQIETGTEYEYRAVVEVDDTRSRGNIVTFSWADLEDEAREEPDVEFLSCTKVEVTGTFEDEGVVAASTGFYDDGLYGNTRVEDGIRFGEDVEAPFSGTVIVEIDEEANVEIGSDTIRIGVPEYGSDGTVITGVTTHPDVYESGGITHFNPNSEECLEEIESSETENDETDSEVSISIMETNSPVNAGEVLEVIAELQNTGNQEVTQDVQLIVGNNPQQVDSRTVSIGSGETQTVTLNFETADVDNDKQFPVRVETSNNSAEETVEVTATNSSSSFVVRINDIFDPVYAGSELEVAFEVENMGNTVDSQDVEMLVDGQVVDSQSIELQAGEKTTTTLSTEVAELGEVEVTIRSETDSHSTPVTIYEGSEPELSIVSTNTPVNAGEYLEVTAELRNPGIREETRNIKLIVGNDPQQVDSQRVTVSAGGSTQVNLGYQTPAVENTQEFPVRVETTNKSDEQTVQVNAAGDSSGQDDTSEQEDTESGGQDDSSSQESGGDGSSSLAISITGTNAPVNAGNQLTVTAQLQSTGSQPVSETVALIVGNNPEQVDSQSVSVSGGGTQTVTLGYSTYPAEQDTSFPVRVEGATDSDQRTVTVYGTG